MGPPSSTEAQLDAIFGLPLLNRTVYFSEVDRVLRKIREFHLDTKETVELSTLIHLLPFGSPFDVAICRLCICETSGNVIWKNCLGALYLLATGSIKLKLESISKLFGFHMDNECIWIEKLIILLPLARSIARSLNKKTNPRFDNIFPYMHGTINYELLVTELLQDYHEQQIEVQLKRASFQASWTHLTTPVYQEQPCSRTKHAACVCGTNIYLLGGRDGRLPLKDFWAYNLVTETWTELASDSESPPHLEEHSMISYGQNIYVFGGLSRLPGDEETPLWIYNTKSSVWRRWQCDGEVVTPPCLRGHTAVVNNREMHVFGGYVEMFGSSDCIWTFDIRSEIWHLSYSSQSGSVGPTPRHHHVAAVHDSAMWIHGGLSSLQQLSDIWKWNLNARKWKKIKCVDHPPALYNHVSFKTGNSLFMYGGETNTQELSSNLWELKFDTLSWQLRNTTGSDLPPALAGHAAVLVTPQIRNSLTVANRSVSAPQVGISLPVDNDVYNRPFSCPSDSESKRFRNRIWPLKLDPVPFVLKQKEEMPALSEKPKTLQQKSEIYKRSCFSDYAIINMDKNNSDLSERLLKRSSTYSNHSGFDNPTFTVSLEEIYNSSGSPVTSTTDVNTACSTRTFNLSKTSRSLDSIQDVLHDDTATLPGVVLSASEEAHLDTCTVRNVIIDCDNSFTAESASREAEEKRPKLSTTTTVSDIHSQIVSENPNDENLVYNLIILGGKGHQTHPLNIMPIPIWSCSLTPKASSQKKF